MFPIVPKLMNFDKYLKSCSRLKKVCNDKKNCALDINLSGKAYIRLFY